MTDALGKLCPRAETPKNSSVYRETNKNGGLGTGAEIQTLAVDTRTAIRASTAEKYRGQNAHPKSEIPTKHRVCTKSLEKFKRTFPCFPMTWERNRAEFVQKSSFRWTFLFFILGGLFRVDFPLKRVLRGTRKFSRKFEIPCQPTPPEFGGWQFHPLNLRGGPQKTV